MKYIIVLVLSITIESFVYIVSICKEDSSLAIGGTGLIIVVGVALELKNQISGLVAGKSYDEVIGGM